MGDSSGHVPTTELQIIVGTSYWLMGEGMEEIRSKESQSNEDEVRKVQLQVAKAQLIFVITLKLLSM